MDLPTLGQPLDVKYLYGIANELNTLKTYVVNRSRLSSIWNPDKGFSSIPTSDVSIWSREIASDTTKTTASKTISFGGTYFQKTPTIAVTPNKQCKYLYVSNTNTAGFTINYALSNTNDVTGLKFSVIAVGIGNNMAS
jgi:hypothetical protein